MSASHPGSLRGSQTLEEEEENGIYLVDSTAANVTQETE